MALLEDLIKDIADPRLRDQIAGEVAKLKGRKKFGLVFEQHLPEVVQLPGLGIKHRVTWSFPKAPANITFQKVARSAFCSGRTTLRSLRGSSRSGLK